MANDEIKPPNPAPEVGEKVLYVHTRLGVIGARVTNIHDTLKDHKGKPIDLEGRLVDLQVETVGPITRVPYRPVDHEVANTWHRAPIKKEPKGDKNEKPPEKPTDSKPE